MSFSQSLLLYTTKLDNKLCITQIEKNETIILDSVCNYKITSYSMSEDSLICLTENDVKKYFSNANFKQLLLKKNNFRSYTDSGNMRRYYYNNYELKEIDYNIILCTGEQIKWEIVNIKNGRKPECKSKGQDINRKLTVFAHPVLSNKGDFFIYNQEKWNWLSSSYKTYEVDMNTGKQIKLFNGFNTQICPTDKYLLFMDVNNKYYIYNREDRTKRTINASSAFWLYN